MTIVEIFEKMRAACPYPCETSIHNLSESLTIDFRWRFRINGRDYGYFRAISLHDIESGHDSMLNMVFEWAASEITRRRIGKEEREMSVIEVERLIRPIPVVLIPEQLNLGVCGDNSGFADFGDGSNLKRQI